MNYKNICLGLFILVIASAIHAAPLVKVEITDAISKKAVCNDGSPATYHLRDGFGSGAKRWVIMLDGGFPCYPECSGTSTIAPTFMTFNVGLLSDNAISNPDFYNANTVSVLNCSQDLWSGNKLQTAGSRPTQFRGRKIFQAVIAELMAKNGNNLLSPGTEILLAGASSGGIGVMVHLDWLARKLPQAKVRGLNDGGWIPQNSTKENVRSFIEEGIERGIPFWNGKADVDCWRANRARKSNCYVSSAYPYITTPLFIAESQYDWIFVLNSSDPTADEFAKAVRDSLVPVHAAWSPRALLHVMMGSRTFSKLKIGNVTYKDVLGNWFFERAGKVKAVKK